MVPNHRACFAAPLLFVVALTAAVWWPAASDNSVLASSADRSIQWQCDITATTDSKNTTCNTKGPPAVSTSGPPSFGFAANPFGFLDCRKQDPDPSIRKLCNPSDAEETATATIERNIQNSHNPSSLESNISRLIQGIHVTDSILSIILTHQQCQPESMQAASGTVTQETPECESARRQDIRSRTEAALIHAYSREPSQNSETALGLWRMSMVGQALTEYVAAQKATGLERTPAMTESLRLRFATEFGNLKNFEGSRRFPDSMLKDYILALEAVE